MVRVASQAAGSLGGGPGPARAQLWPVALPDWSVRVRHHRVVEVAADIWWARSRQVSASAAPYPATSPGASERPWKVAQGMVRCTVPPSAGPVSRLVPVLLAGVPVLVQLGLADAGVPGAGLS